MAKDERMVTKIEGLLATARDEAASEEEAQSALLMAQRLMLKYNIDAGRFEEEKPFDGDTIDVTEYKTLTWWEKHLAKVVSENFRCKTFTQIHKFGGANRIMFFGDKKDLEIAKEVYETGRESFNYFTKKYYKVYYSENPDVERSHATTREMKKSYQLGFIEGLKEKFKAQAASLLEEFGVAVIDDGEVKEAFNEWGEENGMTTRKAQGPSGVKDTRSYERGRQDGRSTSIGKKQIGGEN